MACQPRQVFTRFALAAAIASVLPSGRGLAQERDRAKIPDKYKWNTTDIYPSDEAWRTAKQRLVSEIPELSAEWVIDHLGIEISPTRRKCALLSLKVMRGATTGDPSWPEN